MTDLASDIGQMCIFGWQGETAEHSRNFGSHADELLSSLRVGGIIVMERNVGTGERLRHTLRDFQLFAQAKNLPPLFVCVDQEGGRVSRLKPPYWAPHPSARTLGKSGLPESARAEMRDIGTELANVGINWNFAPVLDVDNNPRNPVIGDRSYSPNPQIVAAFGSEAIRGLQIDTNVMACAKHFPGHGDTETDSHFKLPVIHHDSKRLSILELVPFVEAINEKVAGIMTSHIMFPELDPELPATLSPAILSGLLRTTLNYEGLIVTDCLEMKAVSNKWGSADAAVLSVEAGADILLCCHTLETQRSIVQALIASVESGRIPYARIESSLQRIRAAKVRWLTPHVN